VALVVSTSLATTREMLEGIGQYIHEHDPWTIYIEQRSPQDPIPPWLWSWQGDGIVSLLTRSRSRMFHLGIPTVDLSGYHIGRDRPPIQNDHRAIGALAAAHLLERGFTRFAFMGHRRFAWSRHRYEGFAAAIGAAGYPCEEFQSAQRISWTYQQPSWEEELDDASHWIAALPKPLGLMACDDYRAFQGRGRSYVSREEVEPTAVTPSLW
jgi:LacI family transcriptional regulator